MLAIDMTPFAVNGADWIRLVKIDLGGGSVIMASDKPIEMTGISGARAYATDYGPLCPPSVLEVTPISTELNPVTRESKANQFSVKFAADGIMRSLLVGTALKGKKLVVKIGTSVCHPDGDANMPSGWPTLFTGLIDETLPSIDGAVELIGSDTLKRFFDVDVVGWWLAAHPFMVVKSLASMCGVPSGLLDTTSLDETTGGYTTLNCSLTPIPSNMTTGEAAIYTPTKASDILSSLSTILPGYLLVNEDGKLRFVGDSADPASAAVDTWSANDLTDVEIEESDRTLYNRATLTIGRGAANFNRWGSDGVQVESWGGWQRIVEDDDTASQSSHAYPGQASYVSSHAQDSAWCDAHALVYASGLNASWTPTSPATGDTIDLQGDTLYSFTGARFVGDPKTNDQPSYCALSDSQTAFFLIDSEIIEVDRVTFPNGNAETITTGVPDFSASPPYSASTQVSVVSAARYRIKTRGALGTTAANHDSGNANGNQSVYEIVDVTMPIAACRRILSHCANGLVVISCKTSMAKFGVQVGDYVRTHLDKLFFYGVDGASYDMIWQVIGKEIDPDDSAIKWKLTMVASLATPPASSHSVHGYQYGQMHNVQQTITQLSQHYDGGTIQPYVNNLPGGDFNLLSTGVGTLTIQGGSATFAGARPELPQTTIGTPVTLARGYGNTVFFDGNRKAYTTRATALGAGPATALFGEVPLHYYDVASNGALSGHQDLRPTTGANGARLATGTVTGTAIASGAVATVHVASGGLDASTAIKPNTIVTGHINTGGLDAATALAPRSLPASVSKVGALPTLSTNPKFRP